LGAKGFIAKERVDVDKQKRILLMAGSALLALLTIIALVVTGRMSKQTVPGPTGDKQAFIEMANLAGAPADVQDAAARLKSSRVGYAIVHPEKTYLIISTGSAAAKVAYDKVQAQPDQTKPDLVDVFLRSDPTGSSLLLATAALTSKTEYQFDLDGRFAAIPTLHNAHNLPLIPLDAATRFSLVTPQADFVAENGALHVEGYAQVFEASFMARIATAKGRVIGSAPVKSAAGAPSWGSFVVDIPYDSQSVTETGFLILEEEMSGAKLVLPIRFRVPAQMG
jgi:hypothetical protein